MKRLFTAAVMALSLQAASAIEVEGVKFDDKVKLGNADLIINGTGVRSKFGKRYVAVLYVGAKSADPKTVIESKGPKRVVLHLLKDGDGKTFSKAFSNGIKDNAGSGLAAIQDKVNAFSDIMVSLGDVKAGTVITIDFVPEKGTQVNVNGKPQGKEIAGEDFFKALLKVWLGDDPVQDDLKAGLLGKS